LDVFLYPRQRLITLDSVNLRTVPRSLSGL
jgi:hypothetical protein